MHTLIKCNSIPFFSVQWETQNPYVEESYEPPITIYHTKFSNPPVLLFLLLYNIIVVLIYTSITVIAIFSIIDFDWCSHGQLET